MTAPDHASEISKILHARTEISIRDLGFNKHGWCASPRKASAMHAKSVQLAPGLQQPVVQMLQISVFRIMHGGKEVRD